MGFVCHIMIIVDRQTDRQTYGYCYKLEISS